MNWVMLFAVPILFCGLFSIALVVFAALGVKHVAEGGRPNAPPTETPAEHVSR